MGCPDPGVYPSASHKGYLEWEAASVSALKDLAHAPALFAWHREHPPEETAAMRLGTAFHMAILEPERFETTYQPKPPGDGRTKAVREACLQLEMQGFRLLTQVEFAACRGACESVMKHPQAGGLLRIPEVMREVSLVWDRVTASGIPIQCKARPDIMDPKTGIIIDLKSTTNAAKDAFSRQLHSLHYHWSAAHYILGASECGIKIDAYLFLAVEKEPPYLCALYQLEQTALDVAFCDVERLLDLYAKCQTKEEWPGLPVGVIQIGLPVWAYERAMRGEET